MRVVGGLAIDNPGKLALMGLRKKGKLRPSLWEYPGGKVEPDEPHDLALAREWREELGVVVTVGAHIGVVEFECEEPIEWHLYAVNIVRGVPHADDHEAIAWVDPLDAVRSLPCTPTTYLIYPRVREHLAVLARIRGDRL